MIVNEKKYLEKMVSKYGTKEISKIDELRELDKKSTRGAKIFAYIFGSIASLILGFGMCVAMEVILEGWMWLGILVGVIGIALVSVNYFIYRSLEKKGREKYAEKILTLSNELLNDNK